MEKSKIGELLEKMSNEDLINELLCTWRWDTKDYLQTRTELLCRLELAENLKCCGNCSHIHISRYGGIMCKQLDKTIQSKDCCPSWTTDGLTRTDREGK